MTLCIKLVRRLFFQIADQPFDVVEFVAIFAHLYSLALMVTETIITRDSLQRVNKKQM